MIPISQQEKELISKKFPGVHIVRTMKQDSKRHHYYMEEALAAMHFLRAFRSGEPVRRLT